MSNEPSLSENEVTLYARRTVLGLIAGSVGGALIAACGGGSGDAASDSGGSDTPVGGGGNSVCSEIPDETVGPFPANGTQSGVTNVLADARVLRSDIRGNLDGGTAQSGVPLELTIALSDVGDDCAPLVGAAVYIWHCNADGEYSVYSGAMNGGDHSGTTWLRGVQLSDSNGQVRFTTIYPGRYSGRATHIHVEVYTDDSFKTLLKTSQFAFPDTLNDTVYDASSVYSDSASTRQTDNDDDGIFEDGYDDELLTITGSNAAGYVGTITMGVVAS